MVAASPQTSMNDWPLLRTALAIPDSGVEAMATLEGKFVVAVFCIEANGELGAEKRVQETDPRDVPITPCIVFLRRGFTVCTVTITSTDTTNIPLIHSAKARCWSRAQRGRHISYRRAWRSSYG